MDPSTHHPITRMRELFPPRKSLKLGRQPERLAGACLFVLPSPSGRNATRTYPQMLSAYRSLRRYLDAGAKG